MKQITIFVFCVANASFAVAEGPAQQKAEIITQREISFPADGTIRLNNSYGDLYIEAWDRSKVEFTVTKATRYYGSPVGPKKAGKLETVNVSAERRSDSEVEILTTLPTRHNWAPPLPRTTTNGIRMQYEIHVPRQASLIIIHHGGQVTIGNVTGDVDAVNRDGDILLMLPTSGSYAIDARSKMGHIASDFAGRTSSRFLLGQRFIGANAQVSKRIHLRTGFGGITITALPPEAEALSRGGKE
jgi:hypothetical protein